MNGQGCLLAKINIRIELDEKKILSGLFVADVSAFFLMILKIGLKRITPFVKRDYKRYKFAYSVMVLNYQLVICN